MKNSSVVSCVTYESIYKLIKFWFYTSIHNTIKNEFNGPKNEKINKAAGEDISNQVNLAWKLTMGRNPSQSELELSTAFVKEYGLTAFSRGLFNFNEFVAIE